MAVTLLQRAAPEDLIARLFGVYDQLNVGAIAVGSLIAGPLADRLGADTAIVVVAGSCLVGSALATGALRHGRGRHDVPGRGRGRHARQAMTDRPGGSNVTSRPARSPG